MKTHLKTLLGLSIVGVLTTSCSKDDDNGHTQGYQFEMKAKSKKSAAAGWNITTATAFVSEVELESDDDDNDSELDIEGRYEVNLLTGTSNPPFPVIELSAGTYEELEIELGDDDDDEAFPSLYVEAEWSDSLNTYPVIISIEEELEFELESDDSEIVISEGSVNDLMVYISIEGALSTLIMSQADISSDNTIRIGSEDNPVLRAQFIAALNMELDD